MDFGKFSEIEYIRPDVEEYKNQLKACVDGLKSAKNYEAARESFLRKNDLTVSYTTMYNVVYIRNTMDMNDKFYETELEFFDGQQPYIDLIAKDAAKALLASPYKEDFANEFGADIIKSAEADILLSDDCIVADKIEESKLAQEYSRITAKATCKFMGEDCNFYGLLKYLENPDREIRRAAFKAWADTYASISEKLNELYIKLVVLRKGMAKKLGFKDYATMAYMLNGHYYYGANEVSAFRKQVVEHIVPIACELFKSQGERLGVDKLRYYDEAIAFVDGNAQPQGDETALLEAAAQTYSEMSPETDEFFKFMMRHSLFDLTTRAGKHMGGYCTFIDAYNAPFIFSNFNGTAADVDVLTHEAGHALQAYLSAKKVLLASQIWSTNEISEIHSQTMELFTYPYMDKFFGENAQKYRFGHYTETVKNLSYLCLVDHFQHAVYAEESLTGERLAEIWKGLEKVYLPWRDYDGNEFLSNGGFWMQKQHIFLYPFYYVDYALAQMGAFEYYNRYCEDRERAWADYVRLCGLGGSKSYFETLAEGNLSNPFAEGTVEKIAKGIKDRLNKFN